MADESFLPGVRALNVTTPRLRTALLAAGDEGGVPVIFIHGNASAGRFWEETLAALPPGYRGLAPDLRGYGDSETAPVDATRGLRDFSDDLRALVEALQYAIDHPGQVFSLTLVAVGSPYGFGGTRDLDGTPTWPDFAGSGGGTANPDFVRHLADGDRGTDSPVSPRNVLNAFYFKPPFTAAPDREEMYVTALLSTKVGPGNYPGDLTASENWPQLAPGTQGPNNALAPKYLNQEAFAAVDPRPPVLWIRGADDQIVSDTSLFDFGFLGQIGAVPGWPGAEIYPPQPMVGQVRAVLDRYAANGGNYREEILPDCGHSPHIEHPDEFRRLLFAFLDGAQ